MRTHILGAVATAFAVAPLGLSSGTAAASPYCYETGPGYQKCVDGSSGGFFNPIYQGPQIRDNGALPWAPRYNPAPAYIPPPVYLPPAPPAGANVGPALGSDCIHAEVNNVTVALDGTRVRCTSGPGRFRWIPDTGQTQVDPVIGGRAAWDACMSNPSNSPADCRCSVDGNCG